MVILQQDAVSYTVSVQNGLQIRSAVNVWCDTFLQPFVSFCKPFSVDSVASRGDDCITTLIFRQQAPTTRWSECNRSSNLDSLQNCWATTLHVLETHRADQWHEKWSLEICEKGAQYTGVFTAIRFAVFEEKLRGTFWNILSNQIDWIFSGTKMKSS